MIEGEKMKEIFEQIFKIDDEMTNLEKEFQYKKQEIDEKQLKQKKLLDSEYKEVFFNEKDSFNILTQRAKDLEYEIKPFKEYCEMIDKKYKEKKEIIVNEISELIIKDLI